MYFLQISDSHFLRSFENMEDVFAESLENMGSFSEKLQKIKAELDVPLDFICHCGDLCHGGEEADYQALKDIFQAHFPEIPLITTCGNHDKPEIYRKVFSQSSSPLGESVEVAGLRIISFDSSSLHDPKGEITLETCVWLKNQLKLHENQEIILMTHHHLPQNESPMPPVSCDPLFYQLLKQKNIIAYFTGHTHYHHEGKIEEIPYFTVGSLSFQGNDTGNGLLDLGESACYHLFSYENQKLKLEKVGNVSPAHFLGQVQV